MMMIADQDPRVPAPFQIKFRKWMIFLAIWIPISIIIGSISMIKNLYWIVMKFAEMISGIVLSLADDKSFGVIMAKNLL